jgi:hypothetical protein
MRKGRIRNQSALEEMPLRLMIIVIVLAITIPMIVDALGEFSEDQVEMNVKAEVSKIITAVKLSYSSGVGTSIPVSVSFQNGVMCSINYIRIGDALNKTYESIVRFKITDQPRTFIPVDPYIPMTNRQEGKASGPLVLEAGSYKLHVVHEFYGGKDVVNIVKE